MVSNSLMYYTKGTQFEEWGVRLHTGAQEVLTLFDDDWDCPPELSKSGILMTKPFALQLIRSR